MKKIKQSIKRLLCLIPILKDWFGFKMSVHNQVCFREFLHFKVIKKGVYWPIHRNSEVTNPQNIYVGICSTPGIRPGCYISGVGGIVIGDYVTTGPNVGIISANHGVYNHIEHVIPKNPVMIGDYCWIGQNSVVLPGVKLGPHTIVGAGSIVTKSFPDGYCVIAGNPARLIKTLDKSQCVSSRKQSEYVGFIAKGEFKAFAEKYMPNHKYIDVIRAKKY